MKGKLYTTSLTNSKDLPPWINTKIFAVRSYKSIPNGWIHSGNLCPSKELFFETQKLKKEGNWGEESFNKHYVPKFIKQMQSSYEAKFELRQIMNLLDSGKDVAFACYCSDHNICHRSLIGKFIRKKGYEVILN